MSPRSQPFWRIVSGLGGSSPRLSGWTASSTSSVSASNSSRSRRSSRAFIFMMRSYERDGHISDLLEKVKVNEDAEHDDRAEHEIAEFCGDGHENLPVVLTRRHSSPYTTRRSGAATGSSSRRTRNAVTRFVRLEARATASSEPRAKRTAERRSRIWDSQVTAEPESEEACLFVTGWEGKASHSLTKYFEI